MKQIKKCYTHWIINISKQVHKQLNKETAFHPFTMLFTMY